MCESFEALHQEVCPTGLDDVRSDSADGHSAFTKTRSTF